MPLARRRAGRSRGQAIVIAGALAVVASAAGSTARAENWPGFRGPGGRSVSADKGFPVNWGPQQNVRWRAALPGRSNGSPAVWGDRVFVLQAVGNDKDKRRTVMCFGRRDGALLWQSGVTYNEPEPTHPDNPPCSGTPATDGERVVACFGSAGLFCYDMAGRELWRRDLGKLNHMFGNAISPVIAGELVVLNYGPGEGTRLVAVDKRTGDVRWEAPPPKVDPSEQKMAPSRLGGPGMVVAQRFIGQGDKDGDAALDRGEMAGLAETWFDALDPAKSGTVAKDQFPQRLAETLPQRSAAGAPGGADAARAVGPSLFGAADTDKDGALTRDEFRAAFAKWFDQWGGGKGEPLDLNQVLDGLGALLPPPQAGAGSRGAGAASGANGPGGSWSTPIVVRADGRDTVIAGFPNRLAGYDLAGGELLWWCRGVGDAVHPTPVWDEQLGAAVATSGDMSGGFLVAVRPGGRGDVTDTRVLWRHSRVKGSIGTGVVHDGRLYSVSTDGFAMCADMKTGRQLWRKRLEASGDRGSSWSSLLLADGRIYVPNQSGDVFVIRAGPEFELLATNSVNEPTNASLAASDGDLFLRTDRGLWCVGGGE